MKIFETHAHLNFENYKDDREAVLSQSFKEGIEYIINVGVDQTTSEESIMLAEKYEQIYATVGFHPADADKYDESIVKKLMKHPKNVAIGEIGLDYYHNTFPKEVQKDVFEKQVIIAIENNKPIVIHDRDAHADCFDILARHNPQKVVFHCFSGDEVFADKVLNRDWIISFTGAVTFKNSNMDDIIRMVPKDKFFIETDSPFITPVPFRGKRNAPYHLKYVINKIAEVKHLPPKMIAEASFNNAFNFFLKK